MRIPQTQRIGQYTFTVTQLPPRQAHRLLLRAIKAVGPALAPILTTAGGSLDQIMEAVKVAGTNQAMAGELAMKALKVDEGAPWLDTAVKRIVEGMDEKELDYIMDELATVTVVSFNGKDLGMLTNHFDLCFQDDLKDMYKWLWFAWKTEFASFFNMSGKVSTT